MKTSNSLSSLALKSTSWHWLPVLVSAGLLLGISQKASAQQRPNELQSVTWIPGANVTTSGTSGTLTKSAGGSTTWSAGAISTQRILRDGQVSFKVNLGAQVVVGLSLVNVNDANTDVDYGISVTPAGALTVYENAATTESLGTCSSLSEMTIRRVGSLVQYLVDGVVKNESTLPSAGILMVDCSMYLQGSVIATTQVATGDLDTDGMPDGWEELQLGAAATWPNVVAFLPGGDADSDGVTNLQEFIDNTNAFDVLSCTLPVTWSGLVGTQVQGTNGGLKKIGATAGYNADAQSTQTILEDGKLVFKAPMDSLMAVGLTLANTTRLDTDLEFAFVLAADETFDIQRIPDTATDLSVVAPLGSYTADTIFTIQRVDGTVQFLKDDLLIYSTTNKSTGPLIVDCSMSVLNGQITTARLYNGDVDADALPDAWELLWLPSAATLAQLTAFTSSGNEDSDAATNLQEYQDGTSPLNALSVLQPVTWTSLVGTQVQGINGGLRKIGTTAGYNADAQSTQSIIRDGKLVFKAPLDSLMAVGLTLANTTRLDTDVEFAFVLAADETFDIQRIPDSATDLGVLAPLGTYDANTVFTIERVDGTVRFLKDGLLVYATTNKSTGTLIVDCSLSALTAQIVSARIDTGDVDADGMPDAWELAQLAPGAGLSQLTAFTATGNADGDATTNVQEYLDGTNANNSLSVLQPVVWTSLVGTQVVGSNGGLQKLGGTAGYNADAQSTRTILADGKLIFKAPLDSLIAVGLTPANTLRTDADLEYAFVLAADETFDVQRIPDSATDLGVVAPLGTYNADTVFTIERLAGTVRFWKDGLLVYTMIAKNTAPLLVDCSLSALSSQISSARLDTGDVDNDGMPDAWELSWLPPGSGLAAVTAFLPASDADTDTLTNLQEYQLGLSAIESDTDGDGMADAWEVTMALLPLDPTDAFSDKDGDRVPNLWEYARGTSANNIASVPAFDAIVDASIAANDLLAVPPKFKTLQAAYDFLPATATYRSLVQVIRGNYAATLEAFNNPKKVAWLTSGSYQRSSGLEGVVLTASLNSWDDFFGLRFSDETYLDGFILDGANQSWMENTAITLLPAASVAGSFPEMRMLNCIIRNWRPYVVGSTSAPGAVLNAGGDMWMIHCTVWGCCSQEAQSNLDLSIIENRSGLLRLVNSIVWDDLNTQPFAITGEGLSASSSVIQGGLLGGSNTNPLLTTAGYLRSTSAACLNKVPNTWTKLDINGETRSTLATGCEIGADEWVDTDADTLADWWELFWFGVMTQTATGDLDGDFQQNLAEYIDSTAPVVDQDADGLFDWWELSYFGKIGAQNATGNPDGDFHNNLQEQTNNTDPTVKPWDFDGDADQLRDEWEIDYFGNITSQNASGNPDGDFHNNLQEQTNNTDPTEKPWDFDGDADQLRDEWEIYYFGNITSQNAAGNPDGDARTNLQEQAAYRNPTQMDTDFDGDADGLMDVWEIQYFGNTSSQNGTGNPDGDGRTNSQEQADNKNPTQVDYDFDGDADGLKDGWENHYFGNITSQNGTGNPDEDARTNLQEQQAYTNPTQIDWDFDGDVDGLYDSWEVQYFGNTISQNASGDPDNDLVTNLQEYQRDSDPTVLDTDWDADGLNDQSEILIFGNITSQTAAGDADSDGLTNGQEMILYGSNPLNADTAGLGYGDAFMIRMGFQLNGDTDGDGLYDTVEAELGTSVFLADSDNDGVSDSSDAFPLDSSLSQAPTGVTGAPVVQLFLPVGIQLQP